MKNKEENNDACVTVGKIIVINPGHYEECYPVLSKDYPSFGAMLDHVIDTRMDLEARGFEVTTRDIDKTRAIAREYYSN